MLSIGFLRVQIACTIISLAACDQNINISLDREQYIPVTDAPITLPQGYTRFPNVRSAYKISTRAATWPHARESCNIEGGRLAVIDTTEKMEYLRSQRIGAPPIWVGIYRENYVGHWSAVDRSTISNFLPWGHQHQGGPTRNCLAMYGATPGLRNEPCTSMKKYACEIPDSNN